MRRIAVLARRAAAATAIAATAATAVALATATSAHAGGVAVKDLANGPTANGLAESLAGPGVAVSNVTYTGSIRAAGEFTNGAESIGFEDGVVLDTGKVQTYSEDPPCSVGVEGPNTCYEATEGKPAGPSGYVNSTEFGLPGDEQLSTLSGFETFDAAVLEFEFIPAHPTLQISYVFASEEYSDYANTAFNDVFAFFVNGNNCALVPGTTEPVSVNTINNGSDIEGGVTAPHHAQLFRDNVRPEPTIDTQMDGLTTVLTCTAAVNVGAKNKMKLAIADGGDELADSAVFLQAGSLISGTQVTTLLSGAGKSGATIDVPEGTAVHDDATLAGAGAREASGTVEYKAFSDSECTREAASAGAVTVSSGAVPQSEAITLPPGVYYWQAHYGGDTKNNSSTSNCGSEVETVEAGPTRKPTHLTTSLSGEGRTGAKITVSEGAAVTDTVTIGGEHASTATGAVKFAVFADAECRVPLREATEAVSPGTPTRAEETLAPAGRYYWTAQYGGDATNEPSESKCGTAVETVEAPGPRAPTKLATALSGEGRSGSSIAVEQGAAVSDSAVLSGEDAATASGSVEYRVYVDPACTRLAVLAGRVSVASGAIPASEARTLAAGTYYWQASYGGDARNAPSTSACGSEVETVSPPPAAPPPTTTLGASPLGSGEVLALGEAKPAPVCTRVAGTGRWGGRGPAGGSVANRLSTARGGRQELETTAARSRIRVRLGRLARAACAAIPGGLQFTGAGPASLGRRGGYTASFAIAEKGGAAFYTLVLAKGGKTAFKLLHRRLDHGASERFS